jgi:hypothetical protein
MVKPEKGNYNGRKEAQKAQRGGAATKKTERAKAQTRQEFIIINPNFKQKRTKETKLSVCRASLPWLPSVPSGWLA